MILQNGWFFYWNQPFFYEYFCRLHLSAQPALLWDFFYSPFRILELHQAQGQSQQDPCQSDPFGGRCQHCIQAALLVLAQVRVGRTGQCAGQASLLAGLHQNDTDQRNRADSFQNDQNGLENTHFQ